MAKFYVSGFLMSDNIEYWHVTLVQHLITEKIKQATNCYKSLGIKNTLYNLTYLHSWELGVLYQPMEDDKHSVMSIITHSSWVFKCHGYIFSYKVEQYNHKAYYH